MAGGNHSHTFNHIRSLSYKGEVDTISKSVNELDLITQYISNVLTRLNHANELNNSHQPYEALLALKPVIRILYATKTKDQAFKNTLNEYTKKIDNIEQITKTGSTKAREVFATKYEKNTQAQKLYEEIEMRIWTTLGEQGFFTVDQSYGKGINDEDFKDAEEQ